MSYCRGTYYIWGDNDDINFCHNYKHTTISNNEINVFLYQLSQRKNELKERVKNGKKIYKKAEKEDFKNIKI